MRMLYILIFLGLVLLYFLVTYLLFKAICKNRDNLFTKIIMKSVQKTLEPYHEIIDNGLAWYNSKPSKEVYITSHDNLKLRGIIVECPNAKGTMILCHGYKGGPIKDLCSSLSNYYDMGFNMLLIEQRATNNSEGKYTTCPICGKPVVDYALRIVGFLRPVSSWSKARKNEFYERYIIQNNTIKSA